MSLIFEGTIIPEVKVFRTAIYEDARGAFSESFNAAQFSSEVAKGYSFVQDNQSVSKRGVLRGLHYQVRQPQGTLVRVVRGSVFDVAVDVRQGSPTFAKWVGVCLSSHNRRQIWIPEGFAHGFVVLSDVAEVIYKTTAYYAPEYERSIVWNDPQLGIAWPDIGGTPLLSDKDKSACLLADADLPI